jgi:hypothetical protein
MLAGTSPQQIIARNFPGPGHAATSFLGRLHEDRVWDADEYWKLEYALYQLSNESPQSRITTWHVFRIFSVAFSTLSCHFDPNDEFQVEGLSNDDIYELRERMQLVFEGYFSGSMPEQSIFQVQNPLLQALPK